MTSSITPSQAQTVDRIFQQADSNRDGKLTKSELAQALKSDTVKLSSAAKGETVDQVFQQLDTGKKGYVTRQDLAAASDQMPLALPAGGGKSARAGGGEGGGGGGAVTSTDPADANQDGRVSAAEQTAYALKQYQASHAPPQSTTSAYF